MLDEPYGDLVVLSTDSTQGLEWLAATQQRPLLHDNAMPAREVESQCTGLASA